MEHIKIAVTGMAASIFVAIESKPNSQIAKIVWIFYCRAAVQGKKIGMGTPRLEPCRCASMAVNACNEHFSLNCWCWLVKMCQKMKVARSSETEEEREEEKEKENRGAVLAVYLLWMWCVFPSCTHATHQFIDAAPAVSFNNEEKIAKHTFSRSLSLTLAHAIHSVSVKSHSYKQIKKYKMLFLCFVRSGFFPRFFLFLHSSFPYFLHAVQKWKSENHRRTFRTILYECQMKGTKNESNYGSESAFTFPSDAFKVEKGSYFFYLYNFFLIIDLFRDSTAQNLNMNLLWISNRVAVDDAGGGEEKIWWKMY